MERRSESGERALLLMNEGNAQGPALVLPCREAEK